jgi:C4-dicarboxylate transporter DctQ subunit
MLARIVNGVEEGVISLLLVSMTLLVFVEVVLRYGFGIGFMWVQELTLHMSAWLVLFGASYGVKVGSHIGVDAIVRLLSPPVRRIVTLAAIALCLIYCAVFIQGAWVYLEKMVKIGIHLEDIPIPKYAAHSILLFGFVLLAIRFLQLGWAVFKGDADGFRLADEAKEALDEVATSADEQVAGDAKP